MLAGSDQSFIGFTMICAKCQTEFETGQPWKTLCGACYTSKKRAYKPNKAVGNKALQKIKEGLKDAR